MIEFFGSDGSEWSASKGPQRDGWGEDIQATIHAYQQFRIKTSPESIVRNAHFTATMRNAGWGFSDPEERTWTAEDIVREAGLNPDDWQHILNPPPPPPVPIHVRAKRAVRDWWAGTRLKVGSWIAGRDFGEEDW